MNLFNRKVLIIGIDGATWDIFYELINHNYMPYMKKLKENGAFGVIKSTIPPISPAAWSTIQTGIDPIQNNIYDFLFFDKIKKDMKIVNSTFLKNTIFEILSKIGKKVAAVNIPMTYPPKKVNGYIVSGLLTPSIESNFTFPPEFKNKILERIPDYELRYEPDIEKLGIFKIKEFIQQRIKNVKDRTKVCLYLIRNNNLDFLMVNFQANDVLQHVLWCFLDDKHEKYNEMLKLFIYKEFYKILDLCIETIREEFINKSNADVLSIILSDHGFQTHYKRFYLGNWLYKEGFFKINEKAKFLLDIDEKLEKFLSKIKKSNFIQHYLKVLREISSKSKKFKNKNQKSLFNALSDICNWKKSYIFPMGNDHYGLIFILERGKNYIKLEKMLKSKLLLLKDPETGKTIVEKIFTKKDLLEHEDTVCVPDLIIKPIKGYTFTGHYKKGKKLFEKIEYGKDYLGTHGEDGILIINGADIRKKEIQKANLRDIIPTILNYFHLPIRKDLAGIQINLNN